MAAPKKAHIPKTLHQGDQETVGYLQSLEDRIAALENPASSGGVNVTSFTDLDDVPTSYTGKAKDRLRVNAGETALEFFAPGPEYTSSDQTITPGGSIAVSHGLGAVPSRVQFLLVCQSTDVGFTAGDLLEVTPHSAFHTWSGTSANYQSQGFSAVITTTQVVCYIADPATPSSAAGNDFMVLTGPSGTAFLDHTKWLMRIRASL